MADYTEEEVYSGERGGPRERRERLNGSDEEFAKKLLEHKRECPQDMYTGLEGLDYD